MQSSSVAHAFANDSDEEDEKDKARMTASEIFDKKYSTNKAKKIMKECLESDPSIYEYDEVYDSFKRTRGTTKEQQQADKEQKPKYIDAMLKNHKKRELQKLLHDEHTYKKDREKEAGQFDDSEAFITESYRKKIAEREAFRQEVEREDRMNDALDVKGQQMWQQAFHRKMLEDIADASTTDDVKVKSEAVDQKEEDGKPNVESDQRDSVSSDENDRKFVPPSTDRCRREDEKSHSRQEDYNDDERIDRKDFHCDDRRSQSNAKRRDGRSPPPPSLKERRPKSTAEEEREVEARRMVRIREIVKQRNGPEEIEAARERFFERQPIVPPV